MDEQVESTEVQPGVEKEARSLGWVPQEEFRGNKDKWVDADTFVERGHTIMPILKKTNERLEGRLKDVETKLQRAESLYNASQESISALQKVHQDATKAAVEKARREILAELKTAKETGDIDKELALTEELADVKAKQKELAKPPEPPPTIQDSRVQGAATVHPDFQEWQNENNWFGKDDRKTLRAMGIAQELRSDPEYDSLQGRPFFDKILEVMNERSSVPKMNRVAEPRASGGSGATGKRSFADLPPDAKQACERQGQKLVGEGRAFKDQKSWQTYYTKLYFGAEE